MLARNQQATTSLLGSHVTAYDATSQAMFAQTRTAFMAAGADPVTASNRAYAALFGMVQRQAAMVSFVGLFQLLGVLFIAVVPLVLLMKRPRRRGEAAARTERLYTADVRAWHIAVPLLAVVAAATGHSTSVAVQASSAGEEITVSAQSNTPADTSRRSFAEWLAGVRAEALSRGIRQDVVDQALNQIDEPLPVVIERDRTQAENVLSLEQYLRRRLTPKMVTRGREMFARHHTMLEEIGSRYGVSPPVIVGVWGLESNFGGFSGVRPTIAALATLAWDPRRSELFRGELFNALEILNRGDIEFSRMRGSWAGAMGQAQFMPSSYLKFAEDFDGDGRRDIWSSPPDVFASIANFLKGHGWTAGESWGREVKVSDDAARRITAEVDKRQGTCVATRDMTVALPMKRWQQLGVRLPTGAPLPASREDAGGPGPSDTAALVSGATRHFLVNGNYDALLEYNCAHSYAISVGLLADRIGGAPATRGHTPKRRATGRAGRN